VGRRYHRLVATFAALIALAALAPGAPALGEGTAQTSQVLLPVVWRPADVSPIQFAAQIDANDQLVNPATVFDYGVLDIYAATTVTGGIGQRYSLKWYFNGVLAADSLNDLNVPITRSPQYIWTQFCFGINTEGCTQNKLPISPRMMLVEFYIDGALVQQAQAVIR
jgi:hypothetical protein